MALYLGIVSRVTKTEKMSGVSEGLAENLLRSLGIKIERGDLLLTCQDDIKSTSLDMSSYKDEKDATLPYGLKLSRVKVWLSLLRVATISDR
jgi:hypothetical protein